jgi:hypothetical protein
MAFSPEGQTLVPEKILKIQEQFFKACQRNANELEFRVSNP